MAEENRVERKERNRDGKLFNFRPITIFALFVAVGVLLAYAIIVLKASPWILLIALPFALLIAGLSLPWKKGLIWTVILLVATLIGGASFSYSTHAYKQYSVYDGEYAVVGRVTEKHEYGDSYTLLLEDVSVAEKQEKGKQQSTRQYEQRYKTLCCAILPRCAFLSPLTRLTLGSWLMFSLFFLIRHV